MNHKCNDCGSKTQACRNQTKSDLLYFYDQGIYLCRNCRKKLYLKKLGELLDDKRRR